ncbi:hypothetical protein STCU_01180 [Strigomonas culicis]|uniref:Uncharacterized protein n=1 Tax=Strigomonas culicis TaxID=28005 RepID=S9WHE4_9TRYP|nr:hypothetical protein STCU_01180 [Strigomonas culicis]|eukprot:EPY35240.1 hypothetical protein STCU_01180 [Strigomonas culicis]
MANPRWYNYQSFIYRYGLVFMCAASALAMLNDGGASKQQWEWMRRQYDEKNNGKR